MGALWPQRHQSESTQGPSLLAFGGGWSSLSSRAALGPAGWLWEQMAPGTGVEGMVVPRWQTDLAGAVGLCLEAQALRARGGRRGASG